MAYLRSWTSINCKLQSSLRNWPGRSSERGEKPCCLPQNTCEMLQSASVSEKWPFLPEMLPQNHSWALQTYSVAKNEIIKGFGLMRRWENGLSSQLNIDKLQFMNPNQKLFLKIGITQTILLPIIYIVVGLFVNRSLTESLLSSAGAIVGCWIVMGLFFIGSKIPKK